tara:strand:- start:790 stop:1026 length:237 start_codon:yes stop_codon:yes gene_type:complete
MGSISKKIKRKKSLDARKAAKKKSKEVSKAISRMPKSCSKCGKIFDRTDKQMIQTWMISVYESGESTLTCDMCAEQAK